MSTKNRKIQLVLGIRPDVIRASLIIKKLRKELKSSFELVWSGQHYSENLKDIFFKQLGVSEPEIELGVRAETDTNFVAKLLKKLGDLYSLSRPEAVIFLGDTNTVMGCVAAAQSNIPIFHIEGGMRSYDWRMPEEKYRKVADHLSDQVYCYLDEYSKQLQAEGFPEENIQVSGNPIVDILNGYFINGTNRWTNEELNSLLKHKYHISLNESYTLMTCHRRENVEDEISLKRIISLAAEVKENVLMPMSYRTQKQIRKFNIKIPANMKVVNPCGYQEILELINRSSFILSDSGTLIEESAILGIPSIQLRKSTERPQVYDWNASVKFDPTFDTVGSSYYLNVIDKVRALKPRSWIHKFGDGNTSEKIAENICENFFNKSFSKHNPKLWSPYSERSFQN